MAERDREEKAFEEDEHWIWAMQWSMIISVNHWTENLELWSNNIVKVFADQPFPVQSV